jgi:hypothetical protein
MQSPTFKTACKLSNKAEAYFRYIEGEFYIDTKGGKEQKIYTRYPEPATFTGFALFMGFNSRQELEGYEQMGQFGYIISRSRLRIETWYEKKLHQQSPSGAVFALKNWGWNDKPDDQPATEIQIAALKVEMVESGPALANNEAEVLL